MRSLIVLLDNRCFPSFAQVVIKGCTNIGGAVISRHALAGMVSGIEAAIYSGDELWFGVGMEVSELNQN